MKKFNKFILTITSSLLLFGCALQSKDDISKFRKVETCEISFKPNLGQGKMSPLTFVKESMAKTKLPDCSFTYKYYQFVGWNTQPDGSGFDYLENENVSKIYNDVQNRAITLYAQWELADYVNINYGSSSNKMMLSNSPSTIFKIVKNDAAFEIDTLPEYIESASKVISGFYTNSSYQTKVVTAEGYLIPNVPGYTDENGCWLRNREDTNSLTLYAQWKDIKNVRQISISNTEETVILYDTQTIIATYDPADTTDTITWTSSNSSILKIQSQTYSNGEAKVTYIPNDFGTAVLTCRASSGETVSETITIVGPELTTLDAIKAPDKTKSTKLPEFNIMELSGGNYELMKIYLEEGKSYYFQCADSSSYDYWNLPYSYFQYYCSYSLYDENYNKVDIYNTGYGLSFTPEESGYYVFAVKNSNSTTETANFGVHVYEYAAIKSCDLPSTLTVTSGQKFELPVKFNPTETEETISYDITYNSIYGTSYDFICYLYNSTALFNGTSTVTLLPRIPGNCTLTVKSSITGKIASCNITVMPPEDDSSFTELTIYNEASGTYQSRTTPAGFPTYFKVDLTENVDYTFNVKGMSSYSSGYFFLYDSDWNYIKYTYASYDGTYNMRYTPQKSGTYYLLACYYYYGSYSYGVHTYASIPIQSITLDVDTSSTISLKSNELLKVTATATPSNTNESLTWSGSYIINKTPLTNGSSTATVVGRFPTSSRYSIYAYSSSSSSIKSKYLYYTIETPEPDSMTEYPTSEIGTSASSTITDYMCDYLENGKVKWFKVDLQKDITYVFELANSYYNSSMLYNAGYSTRNYCAYRIYDSNFTSKMSVSYYNTNGGMKYNSYTPTKDGTYYIAVYTDSITSNSYFGLHIYNSINNINSLTLDQTEYYVKSNDTFVVSGTYSPNEPTIDDTIVFPYSQDRYYITSPITLDNGKFSATLKARFPYPNGSISNYFKSSKTGLEYKNYFYVTVENPDDTSSIESLKIADSSSNNINDYSYTNLLNGDVKYYKFTMQANNTYWFSLIHSKKDTSMLTDAGYTTVNECVGYIYDSNFTQILYLYNSEIYTVTAAETKDYYIVIGTSSSSNDSYCGIKAFTYTPITSINNMPDSFEIKKGETKTITVYPNPSGLTDDYLTWSTSDSSLQIQSDETNSTSSTVTLYAKNYTASQITLTCKAALSGYTKTCQVRIIE